MWRFLRILLLSSILLGFLFAGDVSAHPISATPYNCLGHCYGKVYEAANVQSGTPFRFWGATTAADARLMSVSSGFITDEMWLTDFSDPNCTAFLEGGDCWIEVGYAYDRDGEVVEGVSLNTLGTHMFWADARPINSTCGASCGYHEHVKGLFSISSSTGKILMTITNTGRGVIASCTWRITASMSGKSFTGYSTNNCMNGATGMQLGQELFGSGFSGINAVAPAAYFDSNKYQSNVGGSWAYITAIGSVTSNGPPWAGWTYTPGSTHPGGRWHTCTGYSTC